MPRKVVQGNTENLNLLKNKIGYIGFELEKVPDFLKEFEPLEYRAPKVYDETTYKVYKYVKVKDIDILITPKDRLDDLAERYKLASPLFTYMKPETNEDIEKYAYFLKMINQTNIADIQNIEKEQKEFEKEIPFDVKFANNFKWQVFYSDFANKYFMLASTNETDNSPMFYLLKRKIAEYKNNLENETIFIPISNEEYTGKILKKSEIEDLINYIWFFTKDWASVYEITDQEGKLSVQVVGEAKIYDKMTSKYRIILQDKKEALVFYKLLKALFILSYDLPNEYKFQVKISENGGLSFYFKNKKIEYNELAQFLKEEAISKIKENDKVKNETKEINSDIQDLNKKADEQTFEYMRKEREIVNFLECKKTFMGRLKYFFKGKKKKDEEETMHSVSKSRLQNILNQDKTENIHYNDEELNSKNYTVEDIIKIGKQLEESKKENTNAKLDAQAAQSKVDSLTRKLQNADEYLEEIDSHKKSIFEFWKYANKDESKMLAEGIEPTEKPKQNLKKTFDYEEDIEDFAAQIDKTQREELNHKEQDLLFASNYILDAINNNTIENASKILNSLQEEYKKDIEKIEKKDFDIFGNVSEDKTKIKLLNGNKHRENEKDKFKVLNVNLNTEIEEFREYIDKTKNELEQVFNKIKVPYGIALYKASNDKIEEKGFSEFSLSPFDTLDKLEKMNTQKETYLYKINVQKGMEALFYSNIIFYENNNQTLPLGMDVSQEALINMDLYRLELVDSEEFNINMFKDEFENYVKKVKVYEYNLISK